LEEFVDLNNYYDRTDLLIDWVLEVLPNNARVLDVGANDGSFCQQIRRVAEKSAIYAGVDPDSEKLRKHPLLSERFYATLETANIDDCSFDCLLVIYVFEHVAEERDFIRAAGRILRPGGSLFFITPNRLHYFAAIASLFAAIGIQKRILGIIRPKTLVEKYHYPALYRLNTPRKIREIGSAFGFDKFEFRFSENLEEFSCYFPGPLKAFPWLWQQMVKATRQEYLLGNLMGRMIKRDDG
jgi:2-polyprenyl-3-methyl-5-hydroxy-6-metoxy-1,4-benzoquinol methylase